MSSDLAHLSEALTGRYRIERELGQGGMATVYLAHDIKHDRHVALKVLRPELAAVIGGDRFLAEIKTTANLQHPHILALFDSGQVDGTVFYVMPWVHGETLRDRLTRERQLPIDDAIRLAREVADALQYAHDHGVIHRDIKPENILLHGSHAMVADFGIALAASRTGGSRMTETGMSLGTPVYMSPEQAMGERTLDARTDIYALGCVLYEMLTGEAPFTGPTAQAIVGRVLTEKPARVIPRRDRVTPAVEGAVLRALEKLPADRFASAKEFSEALDGRGATTTSYGDATAGAAPGRARWRDPVVLGLALATVAALVWGAIASRRGPVDEEVPVRFTLTPDTAAPIVYNFTWSTVASPDGKLIVYSAAVGGTPQFFVRPIGELQGRAVPGTETGTQPIFSPDGRWLAFIADGKWKKVLLSGGAPVVLNDAGPGNGGDWSSGDVIVSGSPRQGLPGLVKMPASGGAFEQFAVPDTAKGEATFVWPVVLDDGETVAFAIYNGSSTSRSTLAIASIRGGAVTRLGVKGIAPLGVRDGHLIYVASDGAVMAVPFDLRARKVTGNPSPVLDPVAVCPGCNGDAAARLSRSGTLTYMRSTNASRLVWVDRTGRTTPVRRDVANFSQPRLSPDGSRIAVSIQSGTSDIWVHSIASATFTRLTTGANNFDPVWTPDGKRILFWSNADTVARTFATNADGGGAVTPLEKHRTNTTSVMSPDGKLLVFPYFRDSYDLFISAVGDTTQARTFAAGPGDEFQPRFSPDSKWVAYNSTETGRLEVYVRRVDGDAGKVSITASGGSCPVWSADGRRIYYLNGRTMMQANLTTGPASLTVASRDSLFSANFSKGDGMGAPYDVTRDGSRFVMLESADYAQQVVVVTNWPAELRAKMGKKP